MSRWLDTLVKILAGAHTGAAPGANGTVERSEECLKDRLSPWAIEVQIPLPPLSVAEPMIHRRAPSFARSLRSRRVLPASVRLSRACSAATGSVAQ
jgi:hypothetical protein